MKKTLLFVLTLSGLSVLSAKIIREYHYVQKSRTWAGAQSYCRHTFNDLATVKNKADHDRLLSVLQGGGKYAWIGLHDDLTRWKWEWGNAGFNNDTDFSNWKTGEPVVQASNWSCGIMTRNGFWRSSLCHEQRPAVCYHAKYQRYILVKNEMSWYNARRHCRHRYKSLATVRTMAVNNKISSLLTKKTWIGLKRKHWAHWSDKSSTLFTNWSEGQPDNTRENKAACAVVSKQTGEWRDADCEARYYFICQKVQEHKTTLKLKFQSEADLNDPAIQQQILEQLHAKLEKHELPDFKLRWIETDGQIFHKEQEKKQKEGSGGIM